MCLRRWDKYCLRDRYLRSSTALQDWNWSELPPGGMQIGIFKTRKKSYLYKEESDDNWLHIDLVFRIKIRILNFDMPKCYAKLLHVWEVNNQVFIRYHNLSEFWAHYSWSKIYQFFPCAKEKGENLYIVGDPGQWVRQGTGRVGGKPYLVLFNKVLCEFCSVCSDWHICVKFSQTGVRHFCSVLSNILFSQEKLEQKWSNKNVCWYSLRIHFSL